MPSIRTHRSRRTLLATALLGAALWVVQGPAMGRHPNLDLDRLSNAQLDGIFQAELDWDDLAYCGLDNPNSPKTKEEMFDIILCALGDDDDADEESAMDFDDLQAEMAEAGTSVEDVVWAALDRADTMAQGPAADRGAMFFSVRAGTDPAAEVQERYVLRDGRINPSRAALVPVKGGLIQGVRAR